jgi:hypothetical protein
MPTPSKYTAEIAEEILERISQGEPLYRICRDRKAIDPDFPSEMAVRRWAAADVDGFSARFEAARENEAYALAGQILDIADDRKADPRCREVRIKTRQWLAKVKLEKVFGDKIKQDISGDLNIHRVISDQPMDEAGWLAVHGAIDRDSKG